VTVEIKKPIPATTPTTPAATQLDKAVNIEPKYGRHRTVRGSSGS
jgi:hypothetical protein